MISRGGGTSTPTHELTIQYFPNKLIEKMTKGRGKKNQPSQDIQSSHVTVPICRFTPMSLIHGRRGRVGNLLIHESGELESPDFVRWNVDSVAGSHPPPITWPIACSALSVQASWLWRPRCSPLRRIDQDRLCDRISIDFMLQRLDIDVLCCVSCCAEVPGDSR